VRAAAALDELMASAAGERLALMEATACINTTARMLPSTAAEALCEVRHVRDHVMSVPDVPLVHVLPLHGDCCQQLRLQKPGVNPAPPSL
jgi:hypothetical protein